MEVKKKGVSKLVFTTKIIWWYRNEKYIAVQHYV
jgi:hypothetical protein